MADEYRRMYGHLTTMPTTGDIWSTSGVWSVIDTVVVLFICKSKGKAMTSHRYKIFLPSLRKFRIYSGLSMVRWFVVSLYFFFLTYSVYWNVSIDVELINNKTECERYLFFLGKQKEFSFELSISALRLDFRPVWWIYTGISWRKRRFPSYSTTNISEELSCSFR